MPLKYFRPQVDQPVNDEPEQWSAEILVLLTDCEARVSRIDADDRIFLVELRAKLVRSERLSKADESRLNDVWEDATRRG